MSRSGLNRSSKQNRNRLSLTSSFQWITLPCLHRPLLLPHRNPEAAATPSLYLLLKQAPHPLVLRPSARRFTRWTMKSTSRYLGDLPGIMLLQAHTRSGRVEISCLQHHNDSRMLAFHSWTGLTGSQIFLCTTGHFSIMDMLGQ